MHRVWTDTVERLTENGEVRGLCSPTVILPEGVEALVFIGAGHASKIVVVSDSLHMRAAQ